MLDPGRCPTCGADVEVEVTDQPALSFHGGYGATERRAVRFCACGWELTHLVTEIRP